MMIEKQHITIYDINDYLMTRDNDEGLSYENNDLK